MTWKDSVTPAEVVDLLNDLMRRDPAAMRELFRWRVTCNTELALHPGVQVDATDVLSDEPIRHSVGLLGILNALFGLDEGKRGLIREVRGLASGLQKFTLALEYASSPPEQESREQLLARLGAAEAKAAVIGGEACIENRRAGRGPCGACAVCCADLRKELEEAKAAARATRRSMESAHEFLDVWLRELGEDREWLGCAGGPAFGPKRVWIEPTRVRTHDRDCLCLQCLDEAGRGR